MYIDVDYVCMHITYRYAFVCVYRCLGVVVGQRAFACGGAGLFGFVVLLLFVAEQDSRYVQDKSDQLQVCKAVGVDVCIAQYARRASRGLPVSCRDFAMDL